MRPVLPLILLSLLAQTGCPKKYPPPAPLPPKAAPPPRESRREPLDWRALALQVRALVVQVEVEADAPSQVRAPAESARGEAGGDDPFLAEFYKALEDADRRVARSGTGFFITGDYVLTAYHVVRNATKITLRAPSGSWTAAELRGADPANDIALLQPDLPASVAPTPLPLAAESPQPGEPLLLAGYPAGLPLSVMDGIVSQVGVPAASLPFEELIQTDLAVYPGLSGAPLVNARGEVVGVALAAHANARSLGYALSAPVVAAVLPYLLNAEEVPATTWGLSLEWEPGAAAPKIVRVDAGTSAAVAGLSVGDFLLELGGREVKDMDQVQRVLRFHRTKRPIPILLLRAGERLSLALRTDAASTPPVADPAK